MNKKELKNLAEKIASLENQLTAAESMEVKKGIEDAIFKLTGKVKSFEDMMMLDVLIQDIMDKNE